jgi:hypothetical protein
MSNSEIHIFWNIHNTILNMLVIDEIIQCLSVCVHLQTSIAVSANANASGRFIVFTHIYYWIGIFPLYIGCCYNNKIKQLKRKVKNNRNNYDRRTNHHHLWRALVSIQVQYQYLTKLFNKKKLKSLQQRKKIFLILKY